MIPQAELEAAFEDSIAQMQGIVSKAVAEGQGALVSPIVMVLMRKVPDFTGTPFESLSFEPFANNTGEGVQIGIFTPRSLTPKGMDVMPKNVFWLVMKFIAVSAKAYGIIVGMEAWVARPRTPEEVAKIPASIADYEGREEALVVTAERIGDQRLYQAMLKREGDTLSFDPWTKSTEVHGSVFLNMLDRVN